MHSASPQPLHPFKQRTQTSFATAKLIRSKTVILSEAEGSVFPSHHYDAYGKTAAVSSTSLMRRIRGQDKQADPSTTLRFAQDDGPVR